MTKVGIVGAGAMGIGMAQVAATSGCDVVLYDINQEALTKSIESLKSILNRQVQKGRMTDSEVVAILGRIHPVGKLSAMEDRELIIEAIIENLEIKNRVFDELETVVSDHCILASNTSSLSITEMASARKAKGRFIGIHFFNPPALMKLVEIIPCVHTNEGTYTQARKIIESWGKIVVKAMDSPGFIVNKVARPFYSEAIKIYEEGIADVATIDWALTELGGYKMGPFTLMDYIGHDVNYAVTESVWRAFYYDDRYTPSFSQKRLVQAGWLGRKSGKGFYDYDSDATSPQPDTNEGNGVYILNRVLYMLINEAADTVHRGICSEEDVELAMQYGVNYPKGLLAWAEEIGIDEVVKGLDRLYDRYHEARYRVSPYLRDRSSIYLNK